MSRLTLTVLLMLISSQSFAVGLRSEQDGSNRHLAGDQRILIETDRPRFEH